MKKKVVVGMSGGVDSSVAAYLLKEQGYDVIGVTMQIWQDEMAEEILEEVGCGGLSAVLDAQKVAQTLDIPYHVLHFREEFKRDVIDYFVREYQNGRTPNPCNACNRHIKWEALLQKAKELGADYIATGHYARVLQLANGRYAISNSITAEKDQSYALYNLTQNQLAHTLMPVGNYRKSEIRSIAQEIGIPVAAKKDSQDICFVPDHDYAKFIEEYTNRKFEPGKFVDKNGNVLGEHRGIVHYTIGQRKGLNISDETPWFVRKILPKENQILLCKSEDLFETVCYVDDVNYMAIEQLDQPLRVLGRIRYSHKGAMCTIERVDATSIKCTFDEPQRAMTPGQAAVFMDGNIVLCGGTIR